jgi:hypothetical protein
MKDRDDDIEQIIKSARENPSVTADGLHIVLMLSLLCKAVRDLQPRNAT